VPLERVERALHSRRVRHEVAFAALAEQCALRAAADGAGRAQGPRARDPRHKRRAAAPAARAPFVPVIAAVIGHNLPLNYLLRSLGRCPCLFFEVVSHLDALDVQQIVER